MELTDACRSCMKKIKYRNRKKTESPKTLEMFCFCLNVKISDDDNLPKQFCSICINKIEAAYAFITAAQKVDLTIRNLLSRTETSVIVKTEYNHEAEIKVELPDHETSRKNEKSGVKKQDLELPFVLPNTITIKRVTLSTNDHNAKDFLSIKEENDFENYDDSLTILSSESDDGVDEINLPLVDSVKEKEGKKIAQCLFCNKKFGSRLWFYKHMKREHSKKSYKCKFCTKTFSIHSKFKEHVTTHSTERNFSCDECAKRFRTKTQLNDHKQTHSSSTPFVCDICSKSFKRKSVLLHHMRFHEQRKFLCSVCGKNFPSKGNLDTHMRIHTGEKPFQCKECPKAFNTSSSFRRHERGHRGILPYACETCPQRFTTIGSLCRHRRMHTGELPYQCPYCSTAFIDSWKRKTHLMRVHNMTLAEIPRLTREGDVSDHLGRPRAPRGPCEPQEPHDSRDPPALDKIENTSSSSLKVEVSPGS